jgi:hypothetical protein
LQVVDNSDQDVGGATIIPEPGSLIGDLLDMDIGGSTPRGGETEAPDLLGGGLDQVTRGLGMSGRDGMVQIFICPLSSS